MTTHDRHPAISHIQLLQRFGKVPTPTTTQNGKHKNYAHTVDEENDEEDVDNISDDENSDGIDYEDDNEDWTEDEWDEPDEPDKVAHIDDGYLLCG